ncbi:hypothetical protein LCGC14_1085620 [marine sediment metagenome]|uniref:Uncharacterized protein n=1 Tax=marine sediment metagenome TaxID=412755 RepID=A0A0F9PX39_9ZZZZ
MPPCVYIIMTGEFGWAYEDLVCMYYDEIKAIGFVLEDLLWSNRHWKWDERYRRWVLGKRWIKIVEWPIVDSTDTIYTVDMALTLRRR